MGSSAKWGPRGTGTRPTRTVFAQIGMQNIVIQSIDIDIIMCIYNQQSCIYNTIYNIYVRALARAPVATSDL